MKTTGRTDCSLESKRMFRFRTSPTTRARARDPRPVGAREDVRAAPGAEPRRPEVLVRRRAGDREQEARSPHGVGADAEGRLPALQGAARLRAALPERLRLPGPLDRGRRRAPARPELETRDRGVRPRGVRRAAAARSSSSRPRAHRGLDPARPVDGLGQRLLHLQRHEHRVHLAVPERCTSGWLYLGHRSTEWCPRCGTSISAHELVGSYVDRADPSLYVRLPLLERQGEALVVWTTTPWTLPANVAAAVKPDAEYGRRENGEWVAVGATRTTRPRARSAARSSSAGATKARSTTSRRARASSTA